MNDKHFSTRDLLFSSNSKLFDELSLSRRDSVSAFGDVSASFPPFLLAFFNNLAFETGVLSSIYESITLDEPGTKVPVNFFEV